MRIEQRAGAVVRKVSGQSRGKEEDGGDSGFGNGKGETWKDDVVFMFKGLVSESGRSG